MIIDEIAIRRLMKARELHLSLVPMGDDKAPLIANWNRYKDQLQPIEEFNEIVKNLHNYKAIGAIPSGKFVIIDFDKFEDPADKERLIILFCSVLNIPKERLFLVRSGSGTGFHIWIKCDLTEEFNGVSVRVFKSNGRFSHKQIEVRWRGITIIPPSQTSLGKYIFVQFPDGEPPEVDPKDFIKLLGSISVIDIQKYIPIPFNKEKESQIPEFIKESDIARIEELVKHVELNKILIKDPSNSWFKVGYACAALGEMGREYYIRLRSVFPNINRGSADYEFSYYLRKYDGRINYRSLFSLYKDAGIVLSQKTESKELEESHDSKIQFTTPVIPDHIIEILPEPIKAFVQNFDRKERLRERDIALLASIVMIGSVLQHVKVFHDQKLLSITLFLMVTLPAASGKGVLSFIDKAILRVHLQKLLEAAQQNDQVLDGEQGCQDTSSIAHLIPANISSSALLLYLKANISSLMATDEVDLFFNGSKQDWGSQLNEILRKVFDNSRISFGRADQNKRLIEVLNPNMSVIFAGTFKPTFKLFSSTENGLASRFFFYLSKDAQGLRNPFIVGDNANFLDFATDIFGEAVYQIWSKGRFSPQAVFCFTQEQADQLYALFLEFEKQIPTEMNELFRSIHVRLMVHATRIGAVISAVRILHTQETLPNNFTANADDFEIVRSLINVLFLHALALFSNVPPANLVKLQGDTLIQAMFYQELPDRFTRMDAIIIASSLKIPERTADSYLKRHVENGALFKVKSGEYSKKPIQF